MVFQVGLTNPLHAHVGVTFRSADVGVSKDGLYRANTSVTSVTFEAYFPPN
jgi:hypothetical protein